MTFILCGVEFSEFLPEHQSESFVEICRRNFGGRLKTGRDLAFHSTKQCANGFILKAGKTRGDSVDFIKIDCFIGKNIQGI